VLKHFAGIVSEPIIAVHSSMFKRRHLAAANPRMSKKGKRGCGQRHVKPHLAEIMHSKELLMNVNC